MLNAKLLIKINATIFVFFVSFILKLKKCFAFKYFRRNILTPFQIENNLLSLIAIPSLLCCTSLPFLLSYDKATILLHN